MGGISILLERLGNWRIDTYFTNSTFLLFILHIQQTKTILIGVCIHTYNSSIRSRSDKILDDSTYVDRGALCCPLLIYIVYVRTQL